MSELDAKLPERVIFRVNPSLYSAISELADSANRSLNGEICTAVDKWLYHRDSLVLMKDRLLASASAETIEDILTATPSYVIAPEVEGDTCKTTVRFKESVAVDLRAEWRRQKMQTGRVSLNSFLKIVVAWWISFSFQLSECAKAFHKDFQNSIRPSPATAMSPGLISGNFANA
ncbi:hypothetical protein [Pseudomonas sp. MWU12-2323]|uniref:hypothetical protein n=1 Tax=Pseudomonas sp. MWU12-2323 TaxID=2651296 RepID=UPI00128B28D3|nr:hypothetical protein [Pseudomonas sp. MWU12-2323]MPQ71494.1 hypothetical protein [Pseudomonas sp. MWU12-2323]